MPKLPRFSLFLFLLIVLLAAPPILMAQGSQSGNLRGEVKDESGGALPGVTVAATSQERGFSRNTVTDGNGRFLFAAIPMGRYRVVASLSGFETVTVTDNLVETEKMTDLDVTLRLAGQKAEVTVTGEVPIVDRTNTSVNTRLRQTEYQKIPVGRSYQTLFNTAAGVTGAAGTGVAGNPNVHGALSSNNLYMFDGVDITDPTTGTFAGNLNFEAIQEVSIYTAGVSAEYGRSTGGVINVITKSGTNRFEGSAKYLVTNDDWDSQNKTRSQVCGTPATGQTRCSTGTKLERVKFDHENESIAFTLGGPVFPDYAWFFGAYEKAETTSAQRQAVVTLENFQEVLESPFWNVRVTGQPHSSHQLWGKYHESPTNGFMIDYWSGLRAPALAADLEAMTRQDQTSESWAGQWTGVFGSRLTAEALYAETDETITVFPFRVSPLNNGAPHFSLANRLYYNGATFDGFVSRPREQATLAGTYYADLGGNSHSFKAGFDWQHLESGALFAYPNNQFFIDNSFDAATRTFSPFQRQDYDPPAATTSEGDIYAFYLRDKFEVGKRLFFEAGARFEKQEGKSDIGLATVDTTTISPRFSGSYDILGTGKTLVLGTYGRFYQFILQTFSDAFAQIPQQTNYNNFEWDGTRYVFTGRVEAGATTFQRNTDLDPTYVDEFTLGFQQQIGNAIGLGIRGIYREWGDLLDDVRGFNTDRTTFRRVTNYGPAERDFLALELTFEKRFSQNWNANASYTYSRSEGNHFVDNFSGLGNYLNSDCRAGTATAIADSTIGTNGVIPCREVQEGRNTTGRSTFDRPHNVKFSGAYTRPLGPVNLVLGLAGQWISGINYSELRTLSVLFPGTATAAGPTATYFYTKRGSDRLDPVWSIDTSLEATFRLLDRVELGAKGEVFNIFDEQEQITVNNTTFCGDASPTAPLACRNARAIYGTATARGAFQPPRTFRVTALVRF